MSPTNKSDLSTRDWLAIERTNLANERTFLAYLRTAIIFFGSGISLLKIKHIIDMTNLAVFLLVLSPIVLSIGIFRFFKVRKKIHSYYRRPLD